MPTVKIELAEGYDKDSLLKMKNIVMDAVVKSLRLLENDRNIRVIEYPRDLFDMKEPNKLLIEICMFSGRTDATKKLLFQTIVNDLHESKLINRNEILIILNEQPLPNWGVRGGIPANEIDLGFEVNI